MNKILLLSFILSCIFYTHVYPQGNYKTSMLLEWGNGGNGTYIQSIGIYGHTGIVKDILYLDMGGKFIIPIKHAKNNIITQALLGMQIKIVDIDKKIPLFLGARGGYGWMYGKNKKRKGGFFEPFTRIKITKHLSCEYSFNYQYLGKILNTRIYSNIHEGKLIYQL